MRWVLERYPQPQDKKLQAAREWIGQLDGFLAAVHGKGFEICFKDESLAPFRHWFTESRKQYKRTDGMISWRRDAWGQSGCEKLILNRRLRAKAAVMQHIGQSLIEQKSNSDTETDRKWIVEFEATLTKVQALGGWEGIGSSYWLENARKRYVRAQLPQWKMDTLREAGFDRYCRATGWKFDKAIALIRSFREKFGTFDVTARIGYTWAQKWRSRFAESAGEAEKRYFFALIPEMQEADRVSFIEGARPRVRLAPPKDESCFSAIASPSNDFDARFETFSLDGMCGLLERLSKVSKLTAYDQAALEWGRKLLALQEVVSASQDQGKLTAQRHLSRELGKFVEELQAINAAEDAPAWQKRYLGAADVLQYFKRSDPGQLLKAFFDQYGDLDVSRKGREVAPEIRAWARQRRRYIKERLAGDWLSLPQLGSLRESVSEASEKDWATLLGE